MNDGTNSCGQFPVIHSDCSVLVFLFFLSEACVLSLTSHSVLGTLAATYLTIAIIIKYHTMPSVRVPITPVYSAGYDSLSCSESGEKN